MDGALQEKMSAPLCKDYMTYLEEVVLDVMGSRMCGGSERKIYQS